METPHVMIRAVIASLLLIAGLACSSESHARADGGFVVIAAAGETTVAVGDELAPGQRIQIAAGTRILVVSRNGGVIRMTGPCLCQLPAMRPPAARAQLDKPRTRGLESREADLWTVALPKLRTLVTPPDGTTDRGSRTAELADQPDLWAMAVDSSGNRCVRRGEVFLWRREAEAAVSVDLRSKLARQIGVTWPAGQRTLRLPGDFVVDGTPLVLRINSQPRRLVVHVLPETIDEAEWGEILIWMAARDCRRQAQFLVDGLNNGTLFPDHGSRPGLSEL